MEKVIHQKKIFSILKKANLKNLMNKQFYDIKQKI